MPSADCQMCGEDYADALTLQHGDCPLGKDLECNNPKLKCFAIASGCSSAAEPSSSPLATSDAATPAALAPGPDTLPMTNLCGKTGPTGDETYRSAINSCYTCPGGVDGQCDCDEKCMAVETYRVTCRAGLLGVIPTTTLSWFMMLRCLQSCAKSMHHCRCACGAGKIASKTALALLRSLQKQEQALLSSQQCLNIMA